jgi:hypothetical protein
MQDEGPKQEDENREAILRPETDPAGHAALIEKVARFYHKALRSAQKARSWLKRRGLDDEELADHWQLGCADGRLLKTLPSEGEEPGRSLRDLGILTAGGEEFFLHCITVPLLDGDGGLVGLAGSAIGTGEDRLLPASPTALWNAPAARLYSDLILAANLLDGLSLHRAGFPQACAVAGTHLKPQDLALLHDAGVRRILLLGPAAAGKLLAQKGLPELVAQVDRLAASAPVTAGDGRTEPLEQGFAVSFGRRRYEVLGIDKSARRLKITLKTAHLGKLHVDTLDLYHAKSRKTLLQDLCCFFVEPPAVIEGDLAKLIGLCEEFSPASPESLSMPPIMSAEERQEAEAFGRAEDLPDLILRDFAACGLVGERANKLLCYLAAVSRKADEPISVLILSSSGAGKSTLQDATLLLCPPEDVVKLTSLTGKALFYKGSKSLKHKILALEEEAGVRQASYALRNLISAGELVIETTVKDLGSGRMTTMQNRVEGPTAVFITTTNPDVDPETRSRFFVTSVDESREQTRAILESQRLRQTWEGRAGRPERDAVIRKHRNFQRLLKSVGVVNPYAAQLTYSDDRLQSRRDQPKYLNLIGAVAFLRQMQKRPLTHNGRDYVEVDESDLALANELAAEILGKSLDDLNAVSRDLLLQIERMVEQRIEQDTDPETGAKPRRADVAFTRRDIREYTGWPHARVKRYIEQLVEMEYLVLESGRRGFLYRYRLLYDGQGKEGERFVAGLRLFGTNTAWNLASLGQGMAKGCSGVGHTQNGEEPIDQAIVAPLLGRKGRKGEI